MAACALAGRSRLGLRWRNGLREGRAWGSQAHCVGSTRQRAVPACVSGDAGPGLGEELGRAGALVLALGEWMGGGGGAHSWLGAQRSLL